MKKFGNRQEVFRGLAQFTRKWGGGAGLNRDDLVKHRGKLHSTKELAKYRRQQRANLRLWTMSVQMARGMLGLKGFHVISKDTILYQTARRVYDDPIAWEQGRRMLVNQADAESESESELSWDSEWETDEAE
jgi:hypothetical protein